MGSQEFCLDGGSFRARALREHIAECYFKCLIVGSVVDRRDPFSPAPIV